MSQSEIPNPTSDIRKLRHDEIVRTPLDEIGAKPRHPITLIVDNVRSLYNVGSIFRSCDAALVEKLYLCGFTPHPPRKEIEKTALGAVDSVPWEYAWDIGEVIAHVRSRGLRVAALEHTTHSTSCFALTPADFPLAVIVGNEITGLSPAAIAACDSAIEIPMFGVKQSLNVAVATGILLFECVRVLLPGNAAV
jgi:23S rRNA (guanosine2251-2'-O)-methyltransferase